MSEGMRTHDSAPQAATEPAGALNGSDRRKPRSNYIPLPNFIKLNNACIPLAEAFDTHPYLVGSSERRPDWRDVDVRLILADEDYDSLFGSRLPHFWSFFCLAVSDYLSRASDLPVDFQVQRRTTGWQPSCTHEAPVSRALVLDPFMGAGTTALVALRAGRDFVGIELNPEYVRMAEKLIQPYRLRLL